MDFDRLQKLTSYRFKVLVALVSEGLLGSLATIDGDPLCISSQTARSDGDPFKTIVPSSEHDDGCNRM
jgi:hypothetical protein